MMDEAVKAGQTFRLTEECRTALEHNRKREQETLELLEVLTTSLSDYRKRMAATVLEHYPQLEGHHFSVRYDKDDILVLHREDYREVWERLFGGLTYREVWERLFGGLT